MKRSLRFTVYGLLLLTLTSCRTAKVIEQMPVYVHDTISQKVFFHDSTYIDRWHTEYVKGDTVYVTEKQIVSKLRTVTDTMYKYIEKPVTVTVEQIKEVKKPLAWWQKGLMWAGAIGIFIALAAVAVQILRRRTS